MPVWISHRGVRDGNVVENTRESFAAAVRKHFRWLETDLHLTADHHIVLAHDDHFGRMSDDDRPIIKLTRAQVEAISLSDGQHPFFLDEFLEVHAKQSWVFDMKGPTAQAAAAILSRMLTATLSPSEIAKKVKFVAWSRLDEVYLTQVFPGVEVFAREQECWRAGLAVLYCGGFGAGIRRNRTYSLPPELRGKKLFTKELVDKYHAKGGRLIAFLPRSEAEAKEAVAAGFDEILSDGWITK